MEKIGHILLSVPLFSHITHEEILTLSKITRIAHVTGGKIFDLKKSASLNIVMEGLLEIEGTGKSDILYAAPGSFFGVVPFSKTRNRGVLRVLKDSTILMLNIDELYRFFFSHFHAMRGYLKIIRRLGYDTSGFKKEHSAASSSIISVYGASSPSGSTLVSTLIGLSLNSRDKTIILDLTYSGSSVFSLFKKKPPPPLSHRPEKNSTTEKIIHEKIESVQKSLSLLNVAFGSRVKVNPEILSPLISILSQEYRYIIIDVSNADYTLRDNTFALSDRIFSVLRDPGEQRDLFPLFDRICTGLQRVTYLLNEYYSGRVSGISGILPIRKLDITDNPSITRLTEIAEKSLVPSLIELITESKRALILESQLLDSILLSGFPSAFHKNKISLEVIYSSSFSFIVSALFHLSGSENEFISVLTRFFSEDRINRSLDITFPEKHIFKKSLIEKFAEEVAGKTRLENFTSAPAALTGEGENNKKRIFTTGYLKKIITASFSLYPFFEQQKINNNKYSSGYPQNLAFPEDLLRSDIEKFIFAGIDRSGQKMSHEKILQFYNKSLLWAESLIPYGPRPGLADLNLIIAPPNKKLSPERLIEFSRKNAEKLLKENQKKL